MKTYASILLALALLAANAFGSTQPNPPPSGTSGNPSNGTQLTNVLGVALGNYNMDAISAFWGRSQQSGALKILSIGDSMGMDVVGGLMEFFNASIGVNGTGVGVAQNTPWLNTFGTSGYASINGTQFSSTNWWGPHYGLSNAQYLVFNHYPQYSVGDASFANSNVVADTACVVWVNSTNNHPATPGQGGDFIIEVANNGGAFTTIASVSTKINGFVPALGYTNIPLGLGNYTLRVTGAGPGSQYVPIIAGGLYVTNGPGALVWNLCASGHDWIDYVNASTNVLFQLLTNIQPDVIVLDSVHSAVPQYVINTLSNCYPAQIVLMGTPPTTNNNVAYTYALSLANRNTAIRNAATNKWNAVAFCDDFSFMSDTNWSQKMGWYIQGDGTHLAGPGQTMKATTFLRALGIGDAALGLSIASPAQGWANGLNSPNRAPVGIGMRNHLGAYGRTAINVGHGYLGFDDCRVNNTGVWDGTEGLFFFDTQAHMAYDPTRAPFNYETNLLMRFAWQGLEFRCPGDGYIAFGRPNVYDTDPTGNGERLYWAPSGTMWIGSLQDRQNNGEPDVSPGRGVVYVGKTLAVGGNIGLGATHLSGVYANNGSIIITNSADSATTGGGLRTTNVIGPGIFTHIGPSVNPSNIVMSGSIKTLARNTLSLISSNVTVSPYLYTNAFPFNVVVHLGLGTNNGICVNGTFVGTMTNSVSTFILQSGEFLWVTNVNGAPLFNIKPL